MRNIKRMASFLLALALSLTLLPAMTAPAQATEPKLTLGPYDGKNITVYWTGGAALLIIAGYDADGRMLTSRTLQYGGWTGYSVPIDSASIYRAFALNPTTGAPLCASVERVNTNSTDDNFTVDIDGFVAFSEEQQAKLVMSDEVSESTYAALGAYTEAALQMESLWPLLTDKAALQTLMTDAYYFDDSDPQHPVALSRTEVASKVSATMSAYEQALKAAAVLDANTTALVTEAEEEMERLVVRASSIHASDADEAKRLEWAAKITQMYDEHQGGGKLKHLASQLGCDARKAYKVLQMSQDIIKGKALEDAAFYDTCTNAAIVVKDTASVAMFVAGTVASGGLTAAASSVAAGGLGGVVTLCGAVDAVVAVGDAVTTVVYGNESKQAAIYSDYASAISNVTCLFSLCGINKMDRTVDKVFWLGTSFMDKKQEALEFITPMLKDNEVGVQLLRVAMADPTLIGDAYNFCREYSEEVRKALDPSTITRDVAKAMADEYIKNYPGGDAVLSGLLGDRDLDTVASGFGAACDTSNQTFYTAHAMNYEPAGEEDEPLARPKNTTNVNNNGELSGGEEDGIEHPADPGDAYLPDPEGEDDPFYWIAKIEGEAAPEYADYDWVENYYNEYNSLIGQMTYVIDASDGSYWPQMEIRDCGNRGYLVTRYYQKGEKAVFQYHYYGNSGLYKEVPVTSRGQKAARYVSPNENGNGQSVDYDAVSFYPDGRVWKLERAWNGNEMGATYEYSPEGRLYLYRGPGDDIDIWYYVYEDEGVEYPEWHEATGYIFDPSGHIFVYQKRNQGANKFEVDCSCKEAKKNEKNEVVGYYYWYGYARDINFVNYEYLGTLFKPESE